MGPFSISLKSFWSLKLGFSFTLPTLNNRINTSQNINFKNTGFKYTGFKYTAFKYTGEDYASSGNRIREDYHAQGENYEGGFERGQ